MSDRTVRFILTGDSSGAVKAMADTAAATDAAAADMGTKADETGGKLDGLFGKLQNALGNIPVVGTKASGALQGLSDKFDGASSKGEKLSTAMSALGGVTLAAGAAGFIAAGAASVHMATDFQSSMTQLVTGAGESKKNLDMVSQGILDMAGAVGQTPEALAQGMFLIESAGYHGAAGLTVLKSAAQGAATGGAQMSTVANALTTAMHDYNVPTGQANNVTSALIETVASGKTHLEDLAGSLGKVMPQAAALGINFQNVTGAMATMTNAGLTARLASMHLSNTLLAMSAPSSAASKAMGSVGLSSQQVKDALDGPGGLGAALQLIETHVNDTLPKGSVASVNAFKTIMGGATGYSTALMLTGANSKTFEDNVKNIGDRLDGSSKSVQGFNMVQGDLKFQMEQAKATVDALGIKFGDWLIPKIEMAAHAVADIVNWFEKNKLAAEVLGGVIATVLGAAVTVFVYEKAKSFVTAIGNMIGDVQKFGSKLIDFFIPAQEEAGASTQAMGESMQLSFEGMEGAEDSFAATSEATGAASSAAFGPIGLAIMAIVLIGTLLVTHWKQVKEFLVDAWNSIKSFAISVWDGLLDFFKQWWPFVLGIFTGGIGLIVGLLIQHWSTVKADVVTAWDDIVNFFTGIPSKIIGALTALGTDVEKVATDAWHLFENACTTALGTVLGFFTSLPGKIISALGDAGSMLLGWGKDLVGGIVKGITSVADDIGHGLVNAIKSGWNDVKGALNSIPVVGGILSGIGFAEGGIVTKPTFALIGEGQGPEAVLPLNDPNRVRQILASAVPFVPGGAEALGLGAAGASAGGGSSLPGGGGGSPSVIQHITVPESAGPNEYAYQLSLGMRKMGL